MRMRTETLARLGLHGNEVDAVMLVAVDAKSNKTYSGRILPPHETDYYVHAVLGPFKSNVLKVRLRRAK
jgi:hypothetical protein